MNCGGTLEEDTSNNGVVYLCSEHYSWSRCYSNYDSEYCQRCQTFSLDQDDLCNGVFDFPLNETKLGLQRDYYDSKYFLSNCNITEEYNKYRLRYGTFFKNIENNTQEEIKKREKQWSNIKNDMDDAKLYKRWIFFADELNCSPNNQILEISLMINILMSVIIGLISLINFVVLCKRVKSPDSPIHKFLMNLYHANLKYLNVSMSDDSTA